MIKVIRGNTILRVEDDELDYYLGQGFNQIDENGKVIREAVPATKEELRRAYLELKDTVNKLIAENKRLTSIIEDYKKASIKPKTNSRTTTKKK